MKKFLILLFLITCQSNNGFAQTDVTGGLVSGIWSKTNSPYLVQGAIMIADGSELIIEPGVDIIFQGEYKFLVLGRILAIGTATDSIHFTAADTAIGWRGIRFDSTLATNDSSLFVYCKISHAKNKGDVNYGNGGGLYVNYFSKLRISNSRIFNNTTLAKGAGIYCSYSNIVISNNEIIENSASSNLNMTFGGGIFCYNSDCYIFQNVIYKNFSVGFNTGVGIPYGEGGGIFCDDNNSFISSNTIQNNNSKKGGGLFISNDSGLVTDNNISNNFAGYDGGGVLFYKSVASLSNNIISNNIARNGGGLYMVYENNLLISNNLISNNSTIPNGLGGGIYCWDQNSTISNNIISNNSSNLEGGGIYLRDCGTGLTLSKNIISNNHTFYRGGGIYSEYSSSDISKNAIFGNRVDTIYSNGIGGGAGIYLIESISKISNNIIYNNFSILDGGGIYASKSDLNLENNIICNNTAEGFGGAIYFKQSTNPKITLNTIAHNVAQSGGGVYCTGASSPTISNSILFENQVSAMGPEIYLFDDDSDPVISFSNVEGGSFNFGLGNNVFYLGSFQNNTDSNPIFNAPSINFGMSTDTILADWGLQSNSPCIDKGNPNGTYPALDVFGNPRICNMVIDMGAIEYQSANCITDEDDLLVSIDSNPFQIFPNPFQDKIIFQLLNPLNSTTQIRIINLLGQQLDIFSIPLSGKKYFSLDLSHLQNQMLILQCQTENATFNLSVIKIE